MNDFVRYKALSGLIKASETSNTSTPMVSSAYMDGFRKTAEKAGIPPDELIKVAQWWNPATWIGGTIGGVGGALGGLIGGTIGGFQTGQWNVWDAIKNGTIEGARNGDIVTKNALEGIGRGVAELPGFIGGVANGLTTGTYNAIRNGSWSEFGKAYDAGSDFVENHVGYGNADLKHLNQWLDARSSDRRLKYMEENDMDPNDLGVTDKLGLFGMDLARQAGEAIGNEAVPVSAFKATKGLKQGKNVLTKEVMLGKKLGRGAQATQALVTSGLAASDYARHNTQAGEIQSVSDANKSNVRKYIPAAQEDFSYYYDR